MFSDNREKNFNYTMNDKYINEEKLFEDKLNFYEKNSENIYQEKNPKNNLINGKAIKAELNEEEDDYNASVYNIPLWKDKNFMNEIITNNELISKSLNFTEKLYFSERGNLITNSVKFNDNIFSFLDKEEENMNEDTNNLINNIQLFIEMNKKRKKNYMIDLQYNNYFFNSIDNCSTKASNHILSRFSKEFRKKPKQNESSTIPVIHSRLASQQFNGHNLRKNKISKNANYTININDGDTNFKDFKNNNKNDILQYYTNENIKIKNMNRILDLTNLNEENKMNGNSLVNLKYSNMDKNKKIKMDDYARFEEEYAFDSSGNQKFLCVKRLGEENNNMKNLIISPKPINNNNRNIKKNNNLKEIMIRSININNPHKILKKHKIKKNNSNIMEKFVFYSPQISYKNIFSPNSKNCVGKLYKKNSDKMNGSQHYTSLLKEKMNKGNNKINININNNLKNNKSCIFKYWQNKINNKMIKDNNINGNSYNIQFLNSFNKVINSENNINKNNDSDIKSININNNMNINGGNNHTLNNNSRNYNHYMNSINFGSAYKKIYSFNSLQNNNNNNYINDNDNLYNSFRNSKELLYMSNNYNSNNNKIYFPNSNFDNIKVDYSIKNNIKFHEIKVSKEKSNKKINRHIKNNSRAIIDKNKIINLTSLDNTKIHKKYNNLYKIMKDNAIDKKDKNKYK